MNGGGQSEQLRFVHAPDGSVMLFKRHAADCLLPDSRERLLDLVRWRHRLSDRDRREVDARTAWVRHVVTDGRQSVGVLVVPAGDEFWTWRKEQPVPRKIDSIGVPAQRAAQRREDYADVPHTVATLGHLMATLTFLHRHGVVVGDVNRANVLVAPPTAPVPRTYLLDCDSVLLHGRRSLRPAEAEAMRPDDVSTWPNELNRRTDLYKLALISVGAVAKDMALAGVDAEVSRHLPPGHDEFLRRLLDMQREAPNPDHVDAVAKLWVGYVRPDGATCVYRPDSLRPVRWQGPSSANHEKGPARSPVAAVPPVVVPGQTPPRRAPTSVPPPGRPVRPRRDPVASPPSRPARPAPPSRPRVTRVHPVATGGQAHSDHRAALLASIIVVLLVLGTIAYLFS